MNNEQYEEMKIVIDECHSLKSMVDILEESEQNTERTIIIERLKNVNEQCERLQVVIEKFRHII